MWPIRLSALCLAPSAPNYTFVYPELLAVGRRWVGTTLPWMKEINCPTLVTPDFCISAGLSRDLHFQKTITINNHIKLSHPHLGPALICHSLPYLPPLLFSTFSFLIAVPPEMQEDQSASNVPVLVGNW